MGVPPGPEGEEQETATLYDVARLAGVSTATVSRVAHGYDRVSEVTRARVRAVIEELGYVPDGAAQSLSRRRKEVIGLVSVARTAPQYDVESMSLLFYDEILRGVESRLSDEEWSLLITFLTPGDARGFERLRVLSGKVDGLLIGEGIVPPDRLARLAARVPVVVLAGTPTESVVDNVVADNRSGSAALVVHLVKEHGRRRIFHVDGPADAPDARERRAALEAVVAATPRCRLVGSYQGLFAVQSGEEAARAILAGDGPLPDAVVCANDQMAIGVMQTLARRGVKVPQDVAVVGFDDIYPGSLSDPPLTTVHQPMREIGDHACARLLERIAHPGLPTALEVLPTELVIRSSCGCPPGSTRRIPVPRARLRRARAGALPAVTLDPLRGAPGARRIRRAPAASTAEGRP